MECCLKTNRLVIKLSTPWSAGPWTDLGGEDGEDELAGPEGVEDPLDDVEVGDGRDVGLEADVAAGRLRGDVDGHVLPQARVRLLLGEEYFGKYHCGFTLLKQCCLHPYVEEDAIHGVPAGVEQVIVDLHVRQQLVYPSPLGVPIEGELKRLIVQN